MRTITLADVAEPQGLVGGPFGSNLVGADYVAHGVPVIRGTNMGRVWVGGDFVFVTEKKTDRDLARNLAIPGDLVFTQRGTLGQVAEVPRGNFPRYVISQSQMRLRVDRRVAHPTFVRLACESPTFLKQVDDNAISTGVPHINLGILGRLTIPQLALGEQQSIVEVLGALDDKIAANEKLVVNSETLARAEWRVACDQGVWRPLSSMARFVNGKAFTKGASGAGRVVVRIAELNSGLGNSTVYSDIEVANDNTARAGDLLFAWSGSPTAARWFRDEAIINQHIFKCIPLQGLSVAVVNQALHSALDTFRGIAADKATTMGHIQRKHLDLPVPVPPDDRLAAVAPRLDALWDAALATEQESETLIRTRDGLLPLLMSGRLRVKDVGRAIEGVL